MRRVKGPKWILLGKKKLTDIGHLGKQLQHNMVGGFRLTSKFDLCGVFDFKEDDELDKPILRVWLGANATGRSGKVTNESRIFERQIYDITVAEVKQNLQGWPWNDAGFPSDGSHSFRAKASTTWRRSASSGLHCTILKVSLSQQRTRRSFAAKLQFQEEKCGGCLAKASTLLLLIDSSPSDIDDAFSVIDPIDPRT